MFIYFLLLALSLLLFITRIYLLYTWYYLVPLAVACVTHLCMMFAILIYFQFSIFNILFSVCLLVATAFVLPQHDASHFLLCFNLNS
jgi:hypothetical protein